MIPTMPLDVPCPSIEGYQVQPKNSIQSSEMMTGRVRTRILWKNVPSQIRLTYKLTDEQFEYFDGFLKHEASNGAAQFNVHVLLPGKGAMEYVTVKLMSTYQGATLIEGSNRLWSAILDCITIKDTSTAEDRYNELLLGMSYDEALALIDPEFNEYWVPDYATYSTNKGDPWPVNL